ncbi:putative oxalate decarboxylase/oxidase, partial [Tricholoma matsutake]
PNIDPVIATPVPVFIFPATSPINLATRDATRLSLNVATGGAPAAILGLQNEALELQNPDVFAPPKTDNGQQNTESLPIATALAGVNMCLKVGAIHEMHWHNTAEWAYMLKGDVRISMVNPQSEVFVGDVGEGDLWYFPPGNPHSIQAKNTTKDGAEFLIMFDSGALSEDATFLLTDWLAHVPKMVLARNFGVQNLSLFDHIPETELYIFPSSPPPENIEKDMVIPNNTPNLYMFALSKVNATKTPGGSVKVVDSRTFHVAEKVSTVEVEVEVGGIRGCFTVSLAVRTVMMLFASTSNAQTFDFMAGDVGYIPPLFGHYVENTGNMMLKFLEVFGSGLFQDISLAQWLALTPPSLVKAHLGFSDEMIANINRQKLEVV